MNDYLIRHKDSQVPYNIITKDNGVSCLAATITLKYSGKKANRLPRGFLKTKFGERR